jgi:hypothetical protein
LSVFCVVRETFVTTPQKLYKTSATYILLWAVSISPSLILHGRTEIKARALVLGEVSALSFCLLAILPAKGTKQEQKAGAGSLDHLLLLSAPAPIDCGSKQVDNRGSKSKEVARHVYP